MQENKNFDPEYLEDDNFTTNIIEMLQKYLYHWKWFLLGVLIAVLSTFFSLKYTPSMYSVATTILVNDESSGGVPSELSAFRDLGIMSDVRSSLENELEILKSKDLILQVVKDLKLNINYYKKQKKN